MTEEDFMFRLLKMSDEQKLLLLEKLIELNNEPKGETSDPDEAVS